MRGRGCAVVVLAALAAISPAPSWAEPPPKDEQIPFPTKTTILREDGAVYFVEGRVRIPKGCRISCQKDVKIVARGGEAVIEVEGDLKVHGVKDREVIFEGVWIEPQPRFGAVQLDMTIFRDGGGVRSPARAAIDGDLVIENSIFNGSAKVATTMSGGELGIRASSFHAEVAIKAVRAEGAKRAAVKVDLIGNYNPTSDNGGFLGGLVIEGAYKPTVRNSKIAGAKCEFVDCTGLTFDGNKVNSNLLSVRASVPGCFKGTKVQKCDIYSSRVSFIAPKDAGETVIIDKCWFRGLTKKQEILDQVIHDGADDAENGVSVKFRKINGRPLELAGPVDR